MELYAIRNKEGKFLRAKGFSGHGDSWVDTIEKAKIYPKQGVAKAQITFWAKNYPQFGAPDLIVLEATIKEVVSQETRTNKLIEKDKQLAIKQKITKANRRQEEIEKEMSDLRKESTRLRDEERLREEEELKRGYL